MHLCHCLSCFQTQLVKYPSLWFYYDCVHKCSVMCLSLSHWMSCICVSELSSLMLWSGQNAGRGVKTDQDFPNH